MGVAVVVSEADAHRGDSLLGFLCGKLGRAVYLFHSAGRLLRCGTDRTNRAPESLVAPPPQSLFVLFALCLSGELILTSGNLIH